MAGKAKSKDAGENDGSVVVKKYANRRLYNTATSSYVTLDDLSEMVKKGEDFVVYDAKSGEDITRSVLAQIIFEQEGRAGQNLLPITFLRRLIRFYGDSMQSFVPSYLEASMEAFTRQQEDIRSRLHGAWPAGRAMEAFEDQARQNMAVFEQAVRMFAPFAAGAADRAPTSEPSPATAPAGAAADEATPSDAEIAELRKQMKAMQQRLDSLDKIEDA